MICCFRHVIHEELSGISRSEVSRCQSDGSGNEVEFSVDRIVTQAAVDVLPQRLYDKAFKAAKIQASKKTRVLALLKHAHSICAVYRPTLSDLDSFVQGWSACEWPALNREQLLADLTLAVDWYRSGDPMFLSALGLELTKHGGFSAGRGVSKRQSSVYFAALLRNAADGDQYAVESLKTFCVGTRSKEVLLDGVVPIFSAQQQTDLAGSSLAACRIFTYGLLPTTVAGRALTHSLMDEQKTSANATVSTFDDPFFPGAVRHLYLRLFRSGIYRYPRLKQLIESERWDSTELKFAVDDLQKVPKNVLAQFMDLPTLSYDLKGNDSRSRASTGRAVQEAQSSVVTNNVDADDEVLVFLNLWHQTESASSKGTMCFDNRRLAFTRGGGELREAVWLKAMEGLDATDSVVEPSTLASGTTQNPARNAASNSETHMPFVRFVAVEVSPEREDFDRKHQEYAVRVLEEMLVNPPEDYSPAAWMSSAAKGSPQWRTDLANVFARRSAIDLKSDDAITYPILARCPCGEGLTTEWQHQNCFLPPDWLRNRWVAASGHC